MDPPEDLPIPQGCTVFAPALCTLGSRGLAGGSWSDWMCHEPAWELFPQPFLWARRGAGFTSPFPWMTLWLWFFPRSREEPVGISLPDK